MRVEKRDGSHERRILIGMIVDSSIVARLADKWTKDGLFNSRWANIVGTWCIDYHARYNEAPGANIQGLFESWADGNRDKEAVELVERFLESLSGEYEKLTHESNSDYVLDVAATYFNRVRISKLIESLEGDLEAGDLLKAESRIDKSTRISVGPSAGINVLEDTEAMKRAFKRRKEPLIVYPGALGEFFGQALERDSFISFMGPEKRGKTFWLLDIAWRAMLQGRRVAFFEVGDMSESQILMRFAARVTRRPFEKTKDGKQILYPTYLSRNVSSGVVEPEFESFIYENRLRSKDAIAACRKICETKNIDPTLLKLSVHPARTLSVPELTSILVGWEREGWGEPDVIVIDYADLLTAPPGVIETREKINEIWTGLRALSQIYHALVVTATQTDAASYKANLISMSNFSEDKRKLAHVNGMCAINQTSDEKKSQIQRLNWCPLRESDFSEDDCVYVANCLAIANPAVTSCF